MLFEARDRTGYDENYPDELDPANLPLLLLSRGNPVCAFRLDRTPQDTGIIRLMAVPQQDQRKGHGCAAIALLTGLAKNLGLRAILVGAAPDAVGFYTRQGFVVVDAEREAPLLRLDL